MSVLDKQNDSRILVFNLAAEQCTVRSGRCDGVQILLLKLNLYTPTAVSESLYISFGTSKENSFP